MANFIEVPVFLSFSGVTENKTINLDQLSAMQGDTEGTRLISITGGPWYLKIPYEKFITWLASIDSSVLVARWGVYDHD